MKSIVLFFLKKYLYQLIIAVLCLVVGGFVFHALKTPKRNNQFEAIKNESQELRSKLGKSYSQSEQLELTVSQLKKALHEQQDSTTYYGKTILALRATIKDLGIRKSHIKSASVSSSENNVEFITKTEIKYVGKDTVHSFSWKDPYTTVVGTTWKDSVKCTVSSRDTLVQIVERVPKRFLFFRFGTKYLKQTIYSKNPHNNITYSSSISVK